MDCYFALGFCKESVLHLVLATAYPYERISTTRIHIPSRKTDNFVFCGAGSMVRASFRDIGARAGTMRFSGWPCFSDCTPARHLQDYGLLDTFW